MAKKSVKSKSKPKAKAKKPAVKKPAAKAKSKPAAKKVVKAKPKAKPAPKKKVGKAKAKPVAKKKVVTAKAKPIAKKVVKAKVKPVAKKVEKPKKAEKKIKLPKIKPPSKKELKAIEEAAKVVAAAKEQENLNALYKSKPAANFLIPFNDRENERRNLHPKKTRVDPNKLEYSEKELEEFKKIIDAKLVDARKELHNLQKQIANANEHGTDDTAGTFKMLEDGSESLAKEEAGQLAARQQKFIEQLENALVRIENRTYGICRVTGKLIPKERLRAVPHTTQSIEAKLKQYRD